MAGFNMDDYVDVAQRIAEFYERFPTGSLQTGLPPQLMFVDERTFVVYHAKAFRTPDDPCPADGWAWEPVPGPTQFTRDSELQNAETAAWGRAIVALGFATKKIASKQEVQNRQADVHQAAEKAQAAQPGNGAPVISDAQRKRMFAIARKRGVEDTRLKELIQEHAGVASSGDIPKDRYDALIASIDVDDIPFA